MHKLSVHVRSNILPNSTMLQSTHDFTTQFQVQVSIFGIKVAQIAGIMSAEKR
jgi:hypothetical protein